MRGHSLQLSAAHLFPTPKAIRFLLLVALFFGLACRFFGLDWDEGAQLHPDERFCISVVEKLKFPTSLGGFFDSKTSPLNPANLADVHYVYGQLPLFVLKIAAQWAGKPAAPDLITVGRVLSGIFDCVTVLLAFLIARRQFETEKALFCAALVAGAALHIQQSHFFVVDPFAACFTTASFWAGARLVARNRARDALLTGAFFGLALACKISAALFGVALLGFAVVLWRRCGFKSALWGGFWVFVAAAIAFRTLHPMAFRGEFGFFDFRPDPRFWDELRKQGGITRGEVDVPFNVQWIGRAPWGYSLRQLGFWGYGWPFLLFGGLGLWLVLKKPRGQGVLVVAALFALFLVGVQGAAFSKFTRYFLPLTPFCALLAAHAWAEIEKKTGVKRAVFRLGAPLVALSAAVWAGCVTSIYGRPHTRIDASNWINANIAPTVIAANETAWDDGLPLWNLKTTGLSPLDLDLYALDTGQKTALLAAKLDAVEWIFISSGRGWQNIPRWSEKWPVTTGYYRALFSGQLGFRLEKRFASFPTFGPFQFPDASAEEALTVYDHPLVLLFRKTETYDSGQVRAILESIETPDAQDWHPNQAPKPDPRYLPTPPGF